MRISGRALELIQEFEGCALQPEWPGADSGVTIGWGYDLGHERRFEREWRSLLPLTSFFRLNYVCGITGQAAKQARSMVRDIQIPRSAADDVLISWTIPTQEALTLHAFPKANVLGSDAFGALVSLVYNRGHGLIGERRKHMRNIRGILLMDGLTEQEKRQQIAAQIRAMAPLWQGTSIELGMYRRRNAEAALCEGRIEG